MSGGCFTYKKVLICWDGGCGAPYNYVYRIYKKHNRDSFDFLKDKYKITFGCNIPEERNLLEQKIKKYIDKHLKELLICEDDGECLKYKLCIHKGFNREKNHDRRQNGDIRR